VDNFSGDNDPDPEANNNVLNDYVPPGGSGAIGKFTIHDNWNPDPDFMRRAALWGISLKRTSLRLNWQISSRTGKLRVKRFITTSGSRSWPEACKCPGQGLLRSRDGM
jgi:hypothetical protein